MSKPKNKQSYIVWVGGVDDHYTTLREAKLALSEWKDKGYTDVILQTIKL